MGLFLVALVQYQQELELPIDLILSFFFCNSGPNGDIYSWSPTVGLSCSDCPNPIATPNTTTNYILSVNNGFGCLEGYDSIVITVNPSDSTFILDTICSGEPYNGLVYNSDTLFFQGAFSTSSQCDSLVFVDLKVLSDLSFNLGTDTTICSSDSFLLSAGSGSNYNWSNGANTQTIMAGFGTYAVTVSSGDCQAADTIQIDTFETPSAFLSVDTSICPGSSVDLTIHFSGTGPFDATITTIPTGPPISLSNIFDGHTFSVSPSSTTTYSIFSAANDCPAVDLGNPISVTVNPLPTATIGLGGSICLGDSFPLVFNFTGTPPFAVSYIGPTGPVNLSNLNNPDTAWVTPSGTGGNNYILTTVSDSNCSNTVTGQLSIVNITQLPTATISGGGVLCSGSNGTITFTMMGGTLYDLTYTDGTTIFTETNVLSPFNALVSPTDTTTYSLLNISNGTCSDSVVGSTTFNTVPSPTISVLGDTSICEGDSVGLVFSFSGNGPFEVTIDDGTAPTVYPGMVDGEVLMVSPAATTTYTITNVADASTPAACEIQPGITVTVSVIEEITASLMVQGGDSVICLGDTATMLIDFSSNTTASPSGLYDVVYTDGTDTFTLDDIGDGYLLEVNPSDTTTYTLLNLLTNAGGDCDGVIDLIDFEVTVMVNQAATGLMSGDTLLCEGGSANLLFEMTGVAPYTLEYSIDNGTTLDTPSIISNTDVFTQTVTPTITTIYTLISVTDISGGFCPVFIDPLNNSAIVSVIPEVTATISGGGSLCTGDSVSLTINFLPDTGTYDVIYTDGTNNINLDDIQDGYSFFVSPSDTTDYTLVSVQNNPINGLVCAGNVQGLSTVNIVESPSFSMTGNTIICEGANATITFNLTGVAPFDVTYFDGTTNVNLNGINDGHTIVVSPDTGIFYYYPVSVFDQTVLGCGGSVSLNAGDSVSIQVNSLPVLELESIPSTVCAGDSAQIVFHIEGGSGPYNVLYNAGGGNVALNGIFDDHVLMVAPFVTTTYLPISITDGAGCTSIGGTSATVTIDASSTGSISSLAGGALCYGDSTDLVLNLIPATGTFDVVYTDGTDTITLLGVPANHSFNSGALTANTTFTLISIQVTGTACIATNFGAAGSVLIEVNAQSSVSMTGDATICSGANTNLDFTVVTSNGADNSPYAITYSDGTTNTTINTASGSNTISEVVSPTDTTTYSIVSMVDGNGCEGVIGLPSSATVNVAAAPEATLSLATANNVVCLGDSIGLLFTLSGNGPFDVTYTDNIGGGNINLIGISDGHIEMLAPGSTVLYTLVSVSDNTAGGGCTGTVLGNVSITVNPIPTGSIALSADTICAGGCVDLTFTFTGNGPFDVVYTDGVTNYNLNNLFSGHVEQVCPIIGGVNIANLNYSIVSIGDNSTPTCNASSLGAVVPLTVLSLPTAAVALNTNTLCTGDSAELSITFNSALGSGPYTFNILENNAPTGSITTTANPYTINVSPAITTVYSINGMSAEGCVGTNTSQEVLLVVPAIVADISGSLSYCVGSFTTLDADPNNNFQSYLWSTSDISQTIQVSTPGDYSVTVTDAQGCTGVDTVNVTEDIALAVTIQADASDAYCTGDSVVLSPGVFDNYIWSTGQTSPTITINMPGDYAVTVSDATGCEGIDTITITELLLPAVTFLEDTICPTDFFTVGFTNYNQTGYYIDTLTAANGCDSVVELDLFVLTPVPPIMVSDSVCSGEFITVNGIDYDQTGIFYDTLYTAAFGCDSVYIIDLFVQPRAAVTPGNDTTICTGSNILLDAGFADGHLWSTGETSQTIVVNTTGSFSVTVTTGVCVGADTIEITVSPLPIPEINQVGVDTATFCTGSDVTSSVIGLYDEYLWSSGDTTQDVTFDVSGLYTVTVTDQFGCTGTDQLFVLEDSSLVPQVDGVPSLCEGASTTLTVSGAVGGPPTGFTTYTWSTGETTPSITVINPGIYCVSIVDANGCIGDTCLSVAIVNTVYDTITVQVIDGNPYNGVIYPNDTTLTDTLTSIVTGCDSILTTNVDILIGTLTQIDTNVCIGDPFDGIVYNVDTTLIDILLAANGADSIVQTIITILPTFTDTVNITLCAGEDYNGTTYIADATFQDVYPASNNCDSTVTTIITVIQPISTVLNETICILDSFVVGTSVYTTGGLHEDTLVAASTNCDSIVTLLLSVETADTTYLSEVIEEGELYNGVLYLTDTSFIASFADQTSVAACDSIVITNLIVIPCTADAGDISGEGPVVAPYQDAILDMSFTPIYGVVADGFDGILSSDDPTFNRPQNSVCSPSGVGTSVYYEVYAFTVSAADNYTFTQCSPTVDGFAALYENNFDPTDVCANYVASDNDGGLAPCDNDALLTEALVPGITYYLVSSTSSNNDAGAYEWTFTSQNGGQVLGYNASATYGYTYLISDVNGNIIGMDEGPNMQNYPVGTYTVCGLSYYLQDSAALPATDGSVSYAGFSAGLDLVPFTMCADLTDACVSVEITCPSIDTILYQTLCTGDSYNGLVYTNAGTMSIQDTLTDTIPSVYALGCDSIVYTAITVLPNTSFAQNPVICEGEQVSVNGNNYTTTGIYIDTLFNLGANGCDSIITTNLTVNDTVHTTLNPTICEGASFAVGASVYNLTGNYQDTLATSNGCDSIITTNLTVVPPLTTTISDSICAGELYVGVLYANDTILVDSLIATSTNCDSIVTINLTVLPIPTPTMVDIILCPGENHLGMVYTNDTILFDTLSTLGGSGGTVGCDSIVTTTITVLPNASFTQSPVLCEGAQVVVNGNIYDSTGIYVDTLFDLAANGCDSIITTNLTVNDTVHTTLNPTICEGATFSVGTSVYNTTGNYQDTLATSNGCDSIITTNLMVTPPITTMIDTAICGGTVFTVGANVYNTTGIYVDTLLATSTGCDSIITTDLTVDPIPVPTIIGDTLFCFGDSVTLATAQPYANYSWSTGDITPTTNVDASGTYSVTVTVAGGCSGIASYQVTENGQIVPTGIEVQSESAPGASDGIATVSIVGGTGPFTFVWAGTGNATDSIQTNLSAGNYCVTVTDANNCTEETCVTINVPNTLVLDVQGDQLDCYESTDGTITITGTGGVNPYNYVWSDGAGNTGMGMIPTNGGIAVVTDLPAGTYTVTLTDANNIVQQQTAMISRPDPLLLEAVNIQITNVNCFEGADGMITVQATGGTAPYGYVWETAQTGPMVNGLTAGAYQLTVTDANGCELIPDSIIVTEPEVLTLALLDSTALSCEGDSLGGLSVSAAGGTGPYVYIWSTGVSGQSLDSIPAGQYSVTVADQNGCQETRTIDYQEPDPIQALLGSRETSCFDTEDGIIFIPTPSGGTPPFIYSINGGETFGVDTAYGNLAGGTYEVIVQDAMGCEFIQEVVVQQPAELSLDIVLDGGILLDPNDPSEVLLELGDSVQILSSVNFIVDSISWTPDFAAMTLNPDSVLSPIAKPDRNTRYVLTLTDTAGCVISATAFIQVEESINLYVPTAFTPNDDGVNDMLIPITGKGIELIKTFRVFDRWGEMLHEALDIIPGDPDFGWDGIFRGQNASTGVYVWYVEIILSNGREVTVSGDVTLLR